ncbi:MAG: hypothetical protein Rubg2KO_26200 [Rubricoccaceae bacterium]
MTTHLLIRPSFWAALLVLATLSVLPASAQTDPALARSAVFDSGLSNPGYMALMDDGRFLVAEYGSGRVSAYTSDGTRTDFATGLNQPRGVTQLADGRVLVAEQGAGRISEFPSGGGTRTDFATGLNNPIGVTQLVDGRVLVAELNANRVSAFPSSGGTRTDFATAVGGPSGITQLADGRVLVAEYGANRISEFPSSGGTRADFATGLNRPLGLRQLADGRVLVVETAASRISAFPASGGVRSDFAIGLGGVHDIVQLANGRIFATEFSTGRLVELAFEDGTEFGPGSNNQWLPTELADGRILVPNSSADAIYAYTADGTRTEFATGLGDPAGIVQLTDGRILVAELGAGRVSELSADGSTRTDFATGLNQPLGITQLANGRILVVERGAGRVSELSSDGSTRSDFTTGLNQPTGIIQLADGTILVAERGAGRVSELSSDGSTRTDFGTGLNQPHGITQLTDGRVVVAEFGASRTSVFDASGGTRADFAVALSQAVGVLHLSDGRVLVTHYDGGLSVLPASGGRAAFATGISQPWHVVELADGRVLVASASANMVYAYAPDGTRTDFATGLSGPIGVTQLSDGRVLVTEIGTDRVSAFPASGGTRTDFATGLSDPYGITQLADGRILVAENVGRVSELSLTGTRTDFATGLNSSRGITQLADGRVLVTEFGANRVSAFASSGGTRADFATGLGNPIGITQLSNGRILVAEFGGDRISSFAPSGPEGGPARTVVAEGIDGPVGITELSNGRIFVGQYNGGILWTLPGSGPAIPEPPAATVTGVDLLVDSRLDNQTYDATESLSACTDGIIDGDCTLREALLLANANTALDGIGFEIRLINGIAPSLSTIFVSSPLPALTDADIRIDGTTQPLWEAATAETPADIRVELNGTNAGAGANGLALNGTGQSVTGLAITQFDADGISITGNQAAIEGTHIGVGPDGHTPRANGGDGIDVALATGVRIGTNADGTDDDAERNVIAHNGKNGVRVTGATASASVLGNHIARNDSLAIDLGGDGLTANDPDDADAGPNGLQNAPVLDLSASPVLADSVDVPFTLDATPSTTFRLELAAHDPDPSAPVARLASAMTVTTDASGDASGTFSRVPVAPGETLFATVTPETGGVFGGTSEVASATTSIAVSASLLSGPEGWRMLAAPQDTTVGAFLAPLWTQGFTGADSEAGDCSVFRFSESAATFGAGWTCVGNATDALPAGVGTMVYVFEDDDLRSEAPGIQGGFPKRLTSASVMEAASSFTFSPAFTDDARPFTQKGWTLLGSPSGASLHWPSLTRTGIRSTVYVYDPAYNGGDYRSSTVDGGVAYGDLADGMIPPFQGFFVHALAESPSLVAPLAAATPGRDVLGRQAPPVVVRLAVSDAQGERSSAWLALTESGSPGLDDADGARLEPTAWPRAVIYTTPLDAADALVANALPRDLGGASTLDIPLDVDAQGFEEAVELAISADASALPDGWTLTLLDREIGTETQLGEDAAHTFTASPTASRQSPSTRLATSVRPTVLARSGKGTRFALRVASSTAISTGEDLELVTGLGVVAPNPSTDRARVRWTLAEAGPVRVSVFDLLGREVAVLADEATPAGIHDSELSIASWAPGVYVVRFASGDIAQTHRFTVVR